MFKKNLLSFVLFFIDICFMQLLEQQLVHFLLCFLIVLHFYHERLSTFLIPSLLLLLESMLFYGTALPAFLITTAQICLIAPFAAVLNKEHSWTFYLMLACSLIVSNLATVFLANDRYISYTVGEISVNIGIMILFLKYMHYTGRLDNRLLKT